MIKQLVGSATALALVFGAAAPAMAGPWGWGGYGHGGYGRGYGGYGYHHGGDTFGNVLLGAVLGGGLVAIASSASRNKATPSRNSDDQRDDLRGEGSDAREVASMCGDAIEHMARGHVSSIDSVDRDGPGWRVDGVVDVDHDGDRHFFCDVRDGRIETVQLAGAAAARHGAR